MTSNTFASEIVHRLRLSLLHRKDAERGRDPESPARAELFSAERMERYGAELARTHRLRPGPSSDKLLQRLADNERILGNCCRMFSAVDAFSKVDRHITPAGEWLLDNYWMIEEQVQIARRNLPPTYNKELPLLEGGRAGGLPRVYDIALENISHGDGFLDSRVLERFVAAYQTVSPLSLGELWAIPSMLRLALIENLRRIAVRVRLSWQDRQLAAEWADRMIENVSQGQKGLLPVLAALAESGPSLSAAFVAELARRLQSQSAVFSLPLGWMGEMLSETGLSVDEMVQKDVQQQAADQVSISRTLEALRRLSFIDWQEFVENVSLVEIALRQDPAGVYGRMDFTTRDNYRHKVESLAKSHGLDELAVARQALDLARQGAQVSHTPEAPHTPHASDIPDTMDTPEAEAAPEGHVGFYLIDDGLPLLEEALAGRGLTLTPARLEELRSGGTAAGFSVALYLASVIGLAVLLVWPFLHMLGVAGGSTWLLAAAAVPAFLVTSQLSIKLVNWLSTFFVTPHFMPRLDFSQGLPDEARTLVVVPTLLGDADDVDALLDKLEVHYLANRDANLQFGLLTDFKDADSEHCPGEDELLARAEQGVRNLNAKYPSPRVDSFFLLHRPRRWNHGEGVWMGYERKRGKLYEFNALLRGEGQDRFSLVVGNTIGKSDVPPVRYVITLDTDTELPRGAAVQLAAAMRHPLNRPRLAATGSHVSGGYALLQPRLATSLASSLRSDYARLFSFDAGLDPYTRNVSDAYQDLFRQGSFIGKGIYDVRAFAAVLHERFPENRILSHDLIEGCFAHSGLISDVTFYEDYPSSYSADVKRQHRWIRGDWQLLPWLFSSVSRPGGGRDKNPLSALSRWKILDNLRRSLAPLALLSLFLFGWMASAGPLLWTVELLLLLFAMSLLDFSQSAFFKSPDIGLSRHMDFLLHSLGRHVLRAVFDLVQLPYKAFYSTDAALRSLWRMAVSKKHLMQWAPSCDTERSSARGLGAYFRLMVISPLFSLATASLFFVHPAVSPQAFAVALPFLILWLLAPALAWGISRPATARAFAPDAEQERFSGILARKTWGFFEQFVGPEDNWLPPDNYQVDPGPRLARRTSPTNMGLSLLSHLSAHDFGYISCGRLLERLESSLTAMTGLERHRGHFFNWYDTQSKEPLEPRYISTVDSGNLAAHLMTLKAGLEDLADRPLMPARLFKGLDDTAHVLSGVLKPVELCKSEWDAFLIHLYNAQNREFTDLGEAAAALAELKAGAARLAGVCAPETQSEALTWLDSLQKQCADMHDELAAFCLPPEAAAQADCRLPGLRQLATLDVQALPKAARERCAEVKDLATKRLAQIERLRRAAARLADMDFDFLYDKTRSLLAIGYSVAERRRDNAYYDLLASEARLAYYHAIAAGQIPQKSWFAQGRLLSRAGGEPVLLSWSGSMFEYLMPVLVMPSYQGTLLDDACRGAVRRQIEYGRELGLNWGVSESGYNVQDAQGNYQYRAFGVPGLGLKRGLGNDVVLAPYATALALLFEPQAAFDNLARLAGQGLVGAYGLYEAVDYSPLRLPPDKKSVIIKSYMAHHQGMTLLALGEMALGSPMRRRFLAEPHYRALRLLLEERLPDTMPEYLHTCRELPKALVEGLARHSENPQRLYTDPDSAQPAVQLLSNGSYHVMVSSAGGGYSRYKHMAVSRWREDGVRDNHGAFLYLRDPEDGEYWSAAFQPTRKTPEEYQAVFCDGKAEFKVRNKGFAVHTQIAVSPEDDVEIRRVAVTNNRRKKAVIELTSYAEVVLAPPMSDMQHPAFSNLFVETAVDRARQCIFCARRPRSAHDDELHMFHLLTSHGAAVENLSYETDRSRFLGRGRNAARPAAMDHDPQGGGELSGTAGAVLDPVAAIRCRLSLEPGQSAVVYFASGVAFYDSKCRSLASRYRDALLAERVFDLAWTHSQVLLHQYNVSVHDARLFEEMAASIIYAGSAMRASPEIIAANRRGLSGLWAQSISGDYPLVVLRVSEMSNSGFVTQMVRAHAYWRAKGLLADLVILNQGHTSYRQNLQELILNAVPGAGENQLLDKPGGIFVRTTDQLPHFDRIQLEAVARLLICDKNGSIKEQVYRRRAKTALPPACPIPLPEPAGASESAAPGAGRGRNAAFGLEPAARPLRRDFAASAAASIAAPGLVAAPSPGEPARHDSAAPAAPAAPGDEPGPSRPSVLLGNRFGGFRPDGNEYIITLQDGEALPAPWANVIANAGFGTVISENGSAYTWKENAREFRLTPWLNDPVTDGCGEAMYLRDEESGRYWSPTPLPARGKGCYGIRHGFGYSVFSHAEDGIKTELWVYAAKQAPVKLSMLKVYNTSGRQRKLSATGYVEWVLGDLREKQSMHIVTRNDPSSGTLYAANVYAADFPGRVAFFDVSHAERSFTCDRAEFIGRNGCLREPSAMRRTCLAGSVGPGFDPCAALRTAFSLKDGESRSVVFVLGAADSADEAALLAKQYTVLQNACSELKSVTEHWKEILSAVQVESPDPAVDVLVNGWLMYQTIACRYLGRSGYYQSGGAFGFRDQLQDAMSMVHAWPEAVRAHILRAASRQYYEGDVQHWWHPPLNRGVRTRCSDDYLWLPLAVDRYISVTGDTGILDEQVSYIEGRTLAEDEEAYYDLPIQSGRVESLYRHCARAIERGFALGAHGLPLMGGGDWNDGMDKVGVQGRGESVWLGFFLFHVLQRFAPLAEARRETAFAARCRNEAAALRDSLEKSGWDGAWYRRAYFDDGTPLGSAGNEECRIDSISQSWSVLSGAAPEWHQKQAMDSLYEHLVSRDAGLIKLLTPPFDKSGLEPGYIKGYVPGVRENGGQYTHAAIWAVMAFAELGDAAKAWQLLRLINPVLHGADDVVDTYKVESYVVAADVYAVPPHEGRGGWSWYTGAAGWMYRLIVESLLGLRVAGDTLCVEPLLPAEWSGFSMVYRYKSTRYRIRVVRNAENQTPRLMFDGERNKDGCVPLKNDGVEHEIELYC